MADIYAAMKNRLDAAERRISLYAAHSRELSWQLCIYTVTHRALECTQRVKPDRCDNTRANAHRMTNNEIHSYGNIARPNDVKTASRYDSRNRQPYDRKCRAIGYELATFKSSAS